MAAGNDFLGTYTPLANDIAQQTGLDPSVVLGIIDTETGGGSRVLGNNIFGISPGGRVAQYPDVQTASQAFVNLINSRYRGVSGIGDPAGQAAALVRGGYNTVNPNYATMVASKAASFGKQLGYQGDSTQAAAPDYNTTTPAPRSAPDYNITTPAPQQQQAPKPQAQPGSLTQELEEATGAAGGKTSAAAPADTKPKSLTEELEHDIKNPPATPGLTGPPQTGSVLDKVLKPLSSVQAVDEYGRPINASPTLAEQLAKPGDSLRGYFKPDGQYVPPATIPEADANAITPLPEANPLAVSRIIQAGKEGWEGTPSILTPAARDYVDQTGPLGRYIYNPLLDIGSGILKGGGAILRGGQQFVQEATPDIHLPSLPPGVSIPLGGGRSLSGELTPGSLGREIAALPEAFPTGVPGRVTPPRTAQAARNALNRPVTLEELTGAIRRADEAAAADGGPTSANALSPDQIARQAAAQAELEARLRSSAETLRQSRDARGATEPQTQTGTTGLENLGGAAKAMGDNLRDYLWQQHEAGKTTEAGAPSNLLRASQYLKQQGAITDRASFDQFVQDFSEARQAGQINTQEGLNRFLADWRQKEAVANDNAGSQAEAPQAQAAGAQATPSGEIPSQSRVEQARNLRVSINESAKDRAGERLQDDTAYVDGIPPRIGAERQFDAQTALDHKYTYDTDTAYRDAVDRHTTARHNGMVDMLRNDAGDEITLDQARRARREVGPDRFRAFSGESPVDASDIEGRIQDVLNSREGKRDAVERTLNNVKAKLYDRDGNLETMPSQLYGVRQHISDLMDKAARPLDREGSDAQVSRFVLRDLLDRIDAKIQDGAPRYDAYRAAYRDLSQPVNQQRFLQRYWQGTKKLTGSDGKLDLRKVDRLLEDIHKGLTDEKFNLAQSLTPEQIQNIINVRNELATTKLARDQAALGHSPTVQLLNRAAEKGQGTLGVALRAAADYGLHGAAAYAASRGVPGLNAALGMFQASRPIARQIKTQRQQRQREAAVAAMKDRLLSQEPVNPLNRY